MTNVKISNDLKELDKTLERENLTFAEVDSIYNKYISMGSERCKEIDPKISKRIEDYNIVSSFISNHQYDDIKDALKDMDLNPVHKWYVKLIMNGVYRIAGYDNHDYNGPEIRNARDLFSKNTFNSFSDLKKIAEHYKKLSEPSPHNSNKSEIEAVPEI